MILQDKFKHLIINYNKVTNYLLENNIQYKSIEEKYKNIMTTMKEEIKELLNQEQEVEDEEFEDDDDDEHDEIDDFEDEEEEIEHDDLIDHK